MLFFVILTVLAAGANAKFYSDCGSSEGAVTKVSVTDCADDAKECVLKRNSNVTFTIEFTPHNVVKEIQTIVHGVIMNLPVPFPLPQPDACKDNGLTCPLPAGQPQVYHTTMPILKSYPKVRVDVKWELKDLGADGEDIVCILIPARLQ